VINPDHLVEDRQSIHNWLIVLRTWRTLTAFLSKTTDEEACWSLLKFEKEQQNRPLFVKRIYGKASILRARNERAKLKGTK
jgi:hypothetical protein